MTRDDDPTDIAVDALVAGEPMPESAVGNFDPKRAAGLLVVHALLVNQAQGDALATERVLTKAFAQIRAQGTRTTTRGTIIRRTFPLAAAIALVVGGSVWWKITAEHRAVASITAMHQSHGSRRYDLVIKRSVADTSHEVRGTYDVNGEGQLVVRLPLPTGGQQSRVVYGRSATGWWIITPAGEVQRGPDREVVARWIRAVAGDVPVPTLDDTLARLEADYDVSISALADGGDSYLAVLTAKDPLAAKSFELTLNRETQRIRFVRWNWDPPVGSIAALVSVEGRVAERRLFPANWFEPEAHMTLSDDDALAPMSPQTPAPR